MNTQHTQSLSSGDHIAYLQSESQAEKLLIQEEHYILMMKKRYISFGQIQSKLLNIVILLLLLLNLAVYTDMFVLIQETFLQSPIQFEVVGQHKS